MMRVIEVEGGRGEAEALKPGRREVPEPGPGEVRLAVAAAGVNRPDLLQRRGLYPPPPGASDILGLEVSGHVEAVGPGVDLWQGGEAVVALLGGGGYAEKVVVDARHVLPAPEGIDLIAAAGLPETVFTVWANVFEAGALRPGETLAVHGANSGIGVSALQMAKAAGARVVATVRGPDKARGLQALGADVVLDNQAPDFAARLAEQAPDVILDMVGRETVEAGIDALNPGGRLVLIATQSGAKAEVDLARLMLKQLVLTGSTLRRRPAEEKARLAREVHTHVWPWIASGRLRPVIDRRFPLEEAGLAHRHLEAGGHLGKVILTV